MIEDQIKTIAEEIANILWDEDESYNHMLWWSVDPKERKADELEIILKVLLRKYCMVEKDIASEVVNEIEASSGYVEIPKLNERVRIVAIDTLNRIAMDFFGISMFNQNKNKT